LTWIKKCGCGGSAIPAALHFCYIGARFQRIPEAAGHIHVHVPRGYPKSAGNKMANKKRIPATLIHGDGIGPEIVDATVSVLDALDAPFDWDRQLAGMTAVDKGGDPLPEETLDSIRRNKLALKGPLTTPVGSGYRSVNVRLREVFKLFANVRPARSYVPGGRYEDIDLILVRENTEGLYVGVEHYIPIDDDPHAVAEASGIITRSGCRRIAEFTFKYARKLGRKKVTVVHKANILKALTGLFLETVLDVGKNYKDKLVIEDRIVDNCAMQLVINPQQFDVILTTNMFGDILSDEIAGLVGGLGMAPGANIGSDAALFEAVHGSAPDIAGQGIANPTALMLAAAMMLDHVELGESAERLRSAIQTALSLPETRTRDLGGGLTTREFTRCLIELINSG
jgi:isocitrate dehydrogenase (NAD+)